MTNLLISNGSSLVSPQVITSVNDGTGEQQVMRLGGGYGPADVTGSITTATTVVGGATDYSAVGNITVTVKGTYAGVNMSFEASDDGGTNWFPIAGAREDSGISTMVTGVLASNTSYSWAFSMLGFDRFRVRATAWTSGSAAVIISAGTLPFQPKVSSVQANPPNATQVSWYTAAAGVATATTTETLATGIITRDLTASATATTQTVPVGKTFRILSMYAWFKNGTTAITTGVFNLRAIKSGTVTATTGGVVITLQESLAVSATGNMSYTPSSSFIELQSGWSWGVTTVASAATTGGLGGVTIMGIEF